MKQIKTIQNKLTLFLHASAQGSVKSLEDLKDKPTKRIIAELIGNIVNMIFFFLALHYIFNYLI